MVTDNKLRVHFIFQNMIVKEWKEVIIPLGVPTSIIFFELQFNDKLNAVNI